MRDLPDNFRNDDIDAFLRLAKTQDETRELISSAIRGCASHRALAPNRQRRERAARGDHHPANDDQRPRLRLVKSGETHHRARGILEPKELRGTHSPPSSHDYSLSLRSIAGAGRRTSAGCILLASGAARSRTTSAERPRDSRATLMCPSTISGTRHISHALNRWGRHPSVGQKWLGHMDLADADALHPRISGRLASGAA